MDSDKTLEIMDAITRYAEAMSGLRMQLITSGFSTEVAEQIALVVVKSMTR